jgi:hypothetical protein
LLKSLGSRADDDDMGPLEAQSPGVMTPSSVGAVAPAPGGPAWAPGPQAASASSTPTPSSASADGRVRSTLRPMAPWRIVGAVALTVTFVVMGLQVQRLIADRPWSDGLLWLSVFTGVVAACCVLGWTWVTTDNARHLVLPAVRDQIPDPMSAIQTWILPFACVGVAAAVVVSFGEQIGASLADSAGGSTSADTVPTVPLGVAVVALLLAIPMTYRPLHHLAAVVRQVGGSTVRLAQWMWVPVVLGLVGIASIVALRYAGVDDVDGETTGIAAWAPLWVVAVIAIAPCVIVVLLAWRGASAVEDAFTVTAARRRFGVRRSGAPGLDGVTAVRRVNTSRRSVSLEHFIELVPGGELLRHVLVTLLAGLSLLSVVGAVVTGMLWFDSRETGVLFAEQQRTWDTLDGLRAASAGVTAALIAAASAWTFVSVWNVRRASGRRRNPIVAAAAWPAAAYGTWWIADRVIADASVGRVVLGFAAQAAVLAVPFLLLERSALAVDARRTPMRIMYALVVVLLVHVQGLGGLSRLPDSVTTTDVGRLAGYLAIGALIQLCSTLAVTEACQALSQATRHEAEHHNHLVSLHRAASASRPSAEPAASR